MFEQKKFEEITLEELEKKLHEYRSNLSQIEAILEREKNSHPSNKLEDLKKTQIELKQSISESLICGNLTGIPILFASIKYSVRVSLLLSFLSKANINSSG